MAAVTSIALGAIALAGVAQSAYGAKRGRDAAKKAEAEQTAAKKQMESDLYNQQSSSAMRLMRQRILAGRANAGGASPMGAAGTLGMTGGMPGGGSVQKTALGA